MNTISTTRPTSCFSNHFTVGRTSYFFDVKRVPDGQFFVSICELVVRNNIWSRQTVSVPAENMREFYAGLCEAIKVMRSAAAELGIELESNGQDNPPKRPEAPRVTPTVSQAAARPIRVSRATGREASRSAIVA